MLLDIVLLRTFVAVVEAKGFTRAAAFVNLTQSRAGGARPIRGAGIFRSGNAGIPAGPV
jgi:hypothetical protein